MSSESVPKDAVLLAFGKRVRDERKKRGYSQESFAEVVGVHRTYIGMIERGEKNITLINILKIANALNMKVKDLFDF
jgi:transcriptional regulator with XRE-family HTH domain